MTPLDTTAIIMGAMRSLLVQEVNANPHRSVMLSRSRFVVLTLVNAHEHALFGTITGQRGYAFMVNPHRCNDCGAPTEGDELCARCHRTEIIADEYEAMHPEARCPPRE